MGILRRVAKRVLKGSPDPDRAGPAPKGEGRAADPSSLASIACGAQELKERVEAGEDIVLVDVRTVGEVSGGGISGALHMPLSDLPHLWHQVENANEVVCYCAVGKRSQSAAEYLRERGVFNATSLEGGLVAWRRIGGELGPVEVG